MHTPQLYILRHGETEWNAQHKMQGRLNSPLTDKGQDQARAQGALLADVDLSGFDVISSPLGRAFQTAGIALGPLATEIRTDPDLREIDVGAWSGKLLDGLLPAGIDRQDTPDGPLAVYDRAPQGEGFAGLRERCSRFLATLNRPSVLVTHGMTSRMLRAVVLDMADDRLIELPGGQGVVFHIQGGVQKILS